jgi:PAS domain S-box-containing protein
VFAFEHFSHHHREWVCSASPVHDPVSGRLVGVLDLSSPWKIAHPRSLELVTTAARTLEQCLLETRRDQDARLTRRYGDLATKSTDLLVNREGYVLIGDSAQPKPFDVPESGGEITMGDGSLAVAEPLGGGEAYLLRRLAPPRARAARAEALESAEERVHEQAGEDAAPRYGGGQGLAATEGSGRTSIESDQRASAYFEAALDCVIIADASGRVVEFNPAAERTFGYTRDEALGRTMAELIVPPSLRERHITAFARFVETRHGSMLGRRLELTGMRADGSEFPVELALSQVEAEPVLICGALRDLSVAKRAEGHLRELAEEHAALRRVATLVARESSPQQLFAAVAEQVARIINVPLVRLVRYESDGSLAELVGGWGESVDPLAIGARWQLDGPGVLASVWQSGRSARLDDYTDVRGQAAAVVRQAGMRSAVASPITVEDRLWGAIAVLSPRHKPLPENTEARLADFTELVATAIANAESRGELAASEGRARKLATEQAALRRVATLAARESSPVEVLEAVAEEAARVLEVDALGMLRFEPDETATLVAQSETPWDPPPLGTRFTLEGENIIASVHRTGQAARMDDWESATGSAAAMANVLGVRSTVASPIVVEGRLWGTMIAATNQSKPLPADTESRIVEFTELLATSIANAESREALSRLATEQAALRRVATLVAQGAEPGQVFAAVAEEAAGIINTPIVAVFCYESDGTCTTLGVAGESSFVVGSRWPVEEEGISGMILASGRPARKDDYSTIGGPVGEAVREALIVATVGVPIVVEGSIWGFMVAAGRHDRPIPTDTEERLARFTELVATAVSNATMRGELVASRARVIVAADDARRRIEHDLHDGAQQQLVTLALAMRSTEGRIPTGQEQLKAEVGGFADRVTSVVEELREMSRGIHPAILSKGGLSPALEALSLRSAVPVRLNVRDEQRLPDAVEVAAYYVASEALTNASKHADASRVELDLHIDDAKLRLSIRDDGVGGADPSRGSGLIGLKDRVEALGGTIEVESAHGMGTRLRVAIPVPAESSTG